MKRIIFTLLMVVSYMLTSHAANIFTISDVQGRPGEEVTVSVSLDNSDAVSAVDMTIPLDRQLTYVDGSCVLNSSRANGHLITAGANNTELRVVIYDLNTNALKGESGELFSFKLRLKKEPQTYTLTATTVLGNATGGNLHSSVEPGSVTILSPKFTVITTKVDYGHIPIRSTYTQNITIQNSGNERLEVSGVAFSAKEFSTDETLFSVEAGDTKDITINYAPVSRGAISETVTFISNAINGKQKATLVADPFSVNELHVGSASGISDEEVTISLTMNNMEPIVGMSCDFTLPEQLVYVDDSFTASSRAGNLLATSQVNGNKLTLVLYSLNSKVIEGNDGEIATFKVRLNGTSGWYELYPEKVVLSNTTAENMTSATSSGVVQIQSPTISCVDELNMGDNPITELSKAPYKIYNYGEATLTISKVTFLAEGYSIAEQLPISIEPWQEQEITIEYKPTAKGRHSTIMQIYSNDPQNRMKSVEVTGSIHEPNNITVEGDFTENGYDLRVSLENYTEVVALQMDIHWIPQVVANEIKPTDRLNGLSTSITPIGNGVYRVILFSLDNTPISGHSGEIFTISYTHDNEVAIDNSVVTFDNMVFSSKNSENMSSQEAFSYTIPARKAQSITLDRTEVTLKANETTTLTATILPETTTIKDVVWSSSDESVATVENGVVTAQQVGTATITATTTDGTNLSASCFVEVTYTPAQSITLDKSIVMLQATETTTLTATILPETTTIKDVEWKSSDESVATV
ncbi:MAG: Ig-like domain-containing protein, partial [Bacteroidaceae bacterium]|nr:Ig-like domain-containing protein [Bacteroidaceae bacterium]